MNGSALAARDRSVCSQDAPPCGLYPARVNYWLAGYWLAAPGRSWWWWRFAIPVDRPGPGEVGYGLGLQFPPIPSTSSKHCCNVANLQLRKPFWPRL